MVETIYKHTFQVQLKSNGLSNTTYKNVDIHSRYNNTEPKDNYYGIKLELNSNGLDIMDVKYLYSITV